MSLLSIAYEYTSSGLCVIPCKDKRPLISSWTPYQEKLPTAEDLDRMFTKEPNQIAVICGKVSGNLEVIDVDLKNDTTGGLWDLLWNDLLDYFNNEMPLVVVFTPSGGAHLYYRCDVIEGNMNLASRLKDGRPCVLIETRGEHGYVIAPPSPGYTLPDSRLDAIKQITPDQRQDILDICRKYNQVFKTEKAKVSNVQASAYALTPWDAYNNDLNDPWQKVLEDAGWETSYAKEGRTYFTRSGSASKNKANWSEEKRLFYVFSTSTEFDSEKAYTPFAIYAVLKCAGDFSQATRELREAGYGKPFTEKEEGLINKASGYVDKGLDPFDIIRMLTPEYFDQFPEIKELPKEDRDRKATDALDLVVHVAQERHAQAKGLFWVAGKKGVIISERGLVEFLREAGFRLFVQERASMLYRLVYVDAINHLIEEIPIDELQKWVERWVNDHIEDYEVSRYDLLDALIKFTKWPATVSWLHRISIADVSFLRDTKTASYIPFKNGIVHITANEIKILQYHDLPKGMLLWTNQIKDTHIDLLAVDNELQLNQCPVYRFIKRVSGILPDKEAMPLSELARSHPDLFNRFKAFLSTGGYLMSNYKDPGRPYAVILAEDTPTEKDGGGAGKDLFVKILAHLRPTCSFPGKLWKANANFAFQTYKLGDDILYISDVDRHFSFELMYNIISEGLTIEKKNKDALTIPYELSPKVALSTNYNVDDTSIHAARRQKKLLFAKYYNNMVRPEDELGGMFWGPDWTERDWMLFYLLLFTMIQVYLDGGITNFGTTDNMKAKSIKLAYTDEFYEFISGWLEANSGKWKSKRDLYEEFMDDSGIEKSKFTQNRFGRGLAFYAKVYDMQFEEKKNWKPKNGERSQKYLIFQSAGVQIPEIMEDAPF